MTVPLESCGRLLFRRPERTTATKRAPTSLLPLLWLEDDWFGRSEDELVDVIADLDGQLEERKDHG